VNRLVKPTPPPLLALLPRIATPSKETYSSATWTAPPLPEVGLPPVSVRPVKLTPMLPPPLTLKNRMLLPAVAVIASMSAPGPVMVTEPEIAISVFSEIVVAVLNIPASKLIVSAPAFELAEAMASRRLVRPS